MVKIKYIGEHLKAKDYRIPEYDWIKGEIKNLQKDIAERFLESPDFISVEEKKESKSKKDEEVN